MSQEGKDKVGGCVLTSCCQSIGTFFLASFKALVGMPEGCETKLAPGVPKKVLLT